MTKTRIPFPGAGGTYQHREGALVRVDAPTPAPAAANVPPSVPGPLSADDIADAIAALDSDNPALWTRAGKPRVEAIERVLDASITLSERDAAWASYLSHHQTED